jgi:ABC-type nitrate/sulfonate/bicarbonate transport system permease component
MAAVIERRWLASTLFLVLLLALWQLAGALDALPDYILTPSAVVAGLGEAHREGRLFPAARKSMFRLLAGFAIGSSVGVVIGLLAGVSRVAEDLADTVVSLTYPLPKIALFPIVAVWLGFTDRARILVIAISCFYPSFINALAGTRGIEPRLLWVARNAGASRFRAFRQVVLRAAMPSVVTGVRISLALAFILTYATESLGAGRGGLGELIEIGQDNLRYPLMWAGIAAFALLGFAADQLWLRLSGRLLRGQRVEAIGRA